MDPHAGYRGAVAAALPNARIVAANPSCQLHNPSLGAKS